MRDILFRGKRVDNGEWVEGFYVQVDNKAYISLPLDISGDGVITMFDEKQSKAHLYTLSPFLEVVPESVGQYTGLNDKNGNKIFEGDIIRYPRYDDSRIAAVTYSCEDTAYQLTREMARINIGAWFNSFELEIIGNIHDNFELLEVK